MGAVAPNEGASLGERLSIRRVLLRLSLDSAGWRRAKVRLRPAALLRQLTRLSVSTCRVGPQLTRLSASTYRKGHRLLRQLTRLSAGWRRAKVRLRPAALQRQLTRLSASVSVVQPLPR